MLRERCASAALYTRDGCISCDAQVRVRRKSIVIALIPFVHPIARDRSGHRGGQKLPHPQPSHSSQSPRGRALSLAAVDD